MSSSDNKDRLYVVQVDTRNRPSSDLGGYQESTVPSDFFDKLRAKSGSKLVAHKSRIAAECGLDLTVYFSKHKEGLAPAYRRQGEAGVMMRFQADPALLSQNNGAATYLTMDPACGLSEHIVCGRAYAVLDGGRAPLSKAQVWGLAEMVNCLMDAYDMDEQNMRRGRRLVDTWSAQYRRGAWQPNTGAMGMDIYAPR
jgi:hypothetical protein